MKLACILALVGVASSFAQKIPNLDDINLPVDDISLDDLPVDDALNRLDDLSVDDLINLLDDKMNTSIDDAINLVDDGIKNMSGVTDDQINMVKNNSIVDDILSIVNSTNLDDFFYADDDCVAANCDSDQVSLRMFYNFIWRTQFLIQFWRIY